MNILYKKERKDSIDKNDIKKCQIGRIIYLSPTQSEIYYIYLLLTRIVDFSNFENLRIINEYLYSTFKEAYVAHELFKNDIK